MKKKFPIYYLSFVFLIMGFFIYQGCTIKPNIVKDNVSAFDNSTPKEYKKNNPNGGFLGFNTEGKGILTQNARAKYNNLIEMYKNSFFKEKAVKLEKDYGIEPFTDNFGNNLYLINEESLTYFIILNQWLKSNKPRD